MRGVVREPPNRYARDLRANQTPAERKLWALLRDRRLSGFKFRRQPPLGPFIIDSCCLEAKLIVELDGGQHAAQRDADTQRTAFPEGRGYRVLSFWNNDVLANLGGVFERIAEALGPHRGPFPGRERGRHPLPGPLPERERERRPPRG